MYMYRVTRRAIILRGAGLSQIVVVLFNEFVVSPTRNGTTATDLYAVIHFHLIVIMVSESLDIFWVDYVFSCGSVWSRPPRGGKWVW